MAFSRQDTNGFIQRFWRAIDMGNGMSTFVYVTTDAATAVEVSGYISDQSIIDQIQVGDMVIVYQVGALTDGKDIQTELAEGITDRTEHLVVANDGTTVDLSPDVSGGAAVTYTA